MQLGLISDTHGLLRPEAVAALAGVDLILHAGDIGRPEVLEELERIAPVRAVRGNVDAAAEWPAVPLQLQAECNGIRLFMIHDLSHLRPDMLLPRPEIIVFGHSHKPALYAQDGIHYLNPGAAGPLRFSLPISVARMQVEAGKWQVEFINLRDERPLP
jgi:uncharacterized protein